MRMLKYIWREITLVAIVFSLLGGVSFAYGYSNLSIDSLWKRGTGVAIQPLNTTDELGDSSNRIANGYFTALDITELTATTATITGISAGHLIPSVNNTYNIGSSALSWRNIYASSTVHAGGVTSTGNINPFANNSYDLGSDGLFWKRLNVADVFLGNTGILVLTASTMTAASSTRNLFVGYGSNSDQGVVAKEYVLS